MRRYPDGTWTRWAVDFWAFCVAVGIAGGLFVAAQR
jgi:hypothetical protein